MNLITILPLFPDSDKLIGFPLDQLVKMLESNETNLEIYLMGKTMIRLQKRLRNAAIVLSVRRITRMTSRLRRLRITTLLNQLKRDTVSEAVDLKSGLAKILKPTELAVYSETLNESAQMICGIIRETSQSFSHTMPWIRLGHLIPHFLVLCSILSRLNIIAKALLLYCSDLQCGLSFYATHYKVTASVTHETSEALLKLLDKCGIKRMKVKQPEVSPDQDFQADDIDMGVPISRETLNPVSESTPGSVNKAKRKKRSKKKNK